MSARFQKLRDTCPDGATHNSVTNTRQLKQTRISIPRKGYLLRCYRPGNFSHCKTCSRCKLHCDSLHCKKTTQRCQESIHVVQDIIPALLEYLDNHYIQHGIRVPEIHTRRLLRLASALLSLRKHLSLMNAAECGVRAERAFAKEYAPILLFWVFLHVLFCYRHTSCE